MPEESTEDPVDLPLATDDEVTMKVPNGINLSTNDFSLRAVGENHTIKVTGGGNGTYSWVSQDEGVASVDENGKVVAVSNGTVNVVVTDGQKKGVCIVRVRVSGSTTAGGTSEGGRPEMDDTEVTEGTEQYPPGRRYPNVHCQPLFCL